MKYKRLTNKNIEQFDPEFSFCIGCKHFGEPNGCNRINGTCANYDMFLETYTRLYELEDKIENRTLVELPCKIGNKIYVVPSEENFKINEICDESRNKVYEFRVEQILISKYGYAIASFSSGVPYLFNYESAKLHCKNISTEFFYKETWFTTREEAEAKLKELKENRDEKEL